MPRAEHTEDFATEGAGKQPVHFVQRPHDRGGGRAEDFPAQKPLEVDVPTAARIPDLLQGDVQIELVGDSFRQVPEQRLRRSKLRRRQLLQIRENESRAGFAGLLQPTGQQRGLADLARPFDQHETVLPGDGCPELRVGAALDVEGRSERHGAACRFEPGRFVRFFTLGNARGRLCRRGAQLERQHRVARLADIEVEQAQARAVLDLTLPQVVQRGGPGFELADELGAAVGDQDMAGIATVHDALGHVHAVACHVLFAGHIGLAGDRAAVNAHAQVQLWMRFHGAGDLDGALGGRERIAEEDERHAVAGVQAE